MFQASESAHFNSTAALEPATLLRLSRGEIQSSHDVIALRRYVGFTQKQFASAIGISVHTLRNWEQGRRSPEGPALALLRIAARHPGIIRDDGGAIRPDAAVPLS